MNHQPLALGERFLRAAGRFPGRPALRLGLNSYSYRELHQAAIQEADRIRGKFHGPFVPVTADKSFPCFAKILGTLIAGKAYLPLNPKFPAERNRYMADIAGAAPFDSTAPIFPGERPAYLLFTSGTTGKPKGVAVSDSNVSAYLDFMLNAFEFSPEDRFTQVFDLTFDLSVHDLFLCWSAGACLCVPEDNSAFGMAKYLRESEPTIWFSVPSVAALMDRMRLLKPGAFPGIRTGFFCGEPLNARTALAWQKAAPDAKIINLYGPTEATIAITKYELPRDPAQTRQELGIVSIGKVFDGNRAMILHGELCLSGAQVVKGYLDNPEADAQSFFTDDSGIRWYRTGDRVRADDEGDLFYLGRLDAEVKISGYRVNLKEIECVLEEHDGVEQAVVVSPKSEEGHLPPLAFILAAHGTTLKGALLDAYSREKLPWYMVPVKFIFVESIPLNPNGKVDRGALMNKYHGENEN